ncbi:hypothetical protein VZQ01_31360 [Myxococcus faecalis]|uniref:hypothetical protein n=1 Tax=Myxococcus faecalis TaxID=3115646 RepID=UPI003CF2AB11
MLVLLTLLEGLGVTLFVLGCGAILCVVGGTLLDRWRGEHVATQLPLPPVYGRLPAFSLPDEQGVPFEDAHLHGRITLVQFSSGASPRPAVEFTPVLQVQTSLANVGVGAQVVLVVNDPVPQSSEGALPRGWRRVWGGAALESAARALGRAHLPADAGRLLVLVDPAGAVRGIYASSADAPETARKVEEDARCLRTCGPFR